MNASIQFMQSVMLLTVQENYHLTDGYGLTRTYDVQG
jgi:hypothetical protein